MASPRDPIQKRLRVNGVELVRFEWGAAEFPNGREVYLPDHTHFIPMQDSALVARYVWEDEPTTHG